MRFLENNENEMKNIEAVEKVASVAYEYYIGLDHIAFQFETTGVERALEVYESELRDIFSNGHHTGIKVTSGQKGEPYIFKYHKEEYNVTIGFTKGKVVIKITLNGKEVKKFNWRLGFAIYRVVLGILAKNVSYGDELDM